MEKSDDINAASLCNILGVITGIKDSTIVLQDTPAGAFSPVGVFGLDPNESVFKPGLKWDDAGVIDPIDSFLKFLGVLLGPSAHLHQWTPTIVKYNDFISDLRDHEKGR